jgi:hypothetical protein
MYKNLDTFFPRIFVFSPPPPPRCYSERARRERGKKGRKSELASASKFQHWPFLFFNRRGAVATSNASSCSPPHRRIQPHPWHGNLSAADMAGSPHSLHVKHSCANSTVRLTVSQLLPTTISDSTPRPWSYDSHLEAAGWDRCIDP